METDEPLDVAAMVPSQAADELIGNIKIEGEPIALGDQGQMRAFLKKIREAVDDKDKGKVPQAMVTKETDLFGLVWQPLRSFRSQVWGQRLV